MAYAKKERKKERKGWIFNLFVLSLYKYLFMKIETNIPVPKTNYRKTAIEFLNSTKPGDSVLFEKREGLKIRSALASYLNANPDLNSKFTTRIDRFTGKLRIWRSA